MTEGGELGGGEARRSKRCGAPCEDSARRLLPDTFEDDVPWNEQPPDCWQAVEPAAGADTVTGAGCRRLGVLQDGLLHRSDGDKDAIAPIAGGRRRGQPKQQSAQQAGPRAVSARAVHGLTITAGERFAARPLPRSGATHAVNAEEESRASPLQEMGADLTVPRSLTAVRPADIVRGVGGIECQFLLRNIL